MIRHLSMLALLALAAVACKREAPVEPTTPESATSAAATDAPAPPVASESTPASAPADAPFDVKAFAGTFTGTLPCADCPGIDTRLTLAADGTYQLHEVYQGKPGGGFDRDGTWTVEDDGKRLRLDPNSKQERDRLFAIASKQRIDGLDLEGKPIDTTMPNSLTREGAAQ